MAEALPAQARAVIIGGGIVGCSVAYHLAKLGWQDVILLERGSLTCGTTWHAAGLVGQLRPYARMTQLRRTASLAGAFGVEAHVITAREAGERWPLMRVDDLVGAVWLPGDGKANPSDLTQALARGARTRGVRIFENVKVTGVTAKHGRAIGVTTAAGDIAAEVVVNTAGMWARDLAAACGVTVPLHAVEHMYIVTRPIDGVRPDLPVMRDPDGMIYFKEEVGGLVMGGFEPNAKIWGEHGIPEDFAFSLLKEDWAQFEPLMTHAIERVPLLEKTEVHRMVNGPESFTPDNQFIIGEAPDLHGFYVAAGFNSAGIASAGGAGRALAEWIDESRPTADLWPVDVRRFARVHRNQRWLRERVPEIPSLHYAVAWPFKEFETGRNLRRSPLYERLAGKRACFGVRLGWERANWFAPAGIEPKNVYAWGPQNWVPYSAMEHRAAREAVAVWDQTSFSKFLLQGRDAEAVLQRLCGNNVAVAPGRIVYTGLFNERGGYESDLTVTRLAEDAYFIVTGSAQTTRDFDYLRRNIPPEAHAVLADVTSAWSVLGVMGPHSRTLLSRLTTADLSNRAFAFSTMQEIEMGPVPVRALRITYVGELGWELYIPTESATIVYDLLAEAGADLGLRDAGFYALDSLRLEKAYRLWGRDITPDDTPIEAGLAWAVRFDKKPAFIGREALLRQREQGVTKRLAIFTLDDPSAYPLGDEPILRNGRSVGSLSSAGFGHSLGRAVGMGYVRNPEGVDEAFVESGSYEIEIAGERFTATVSLQPPYDPTSARVRG
jgi:glycine cleavage system aminomethyltransferase T/glycine/D-amino acid oxidase-like deaminating enzyme